MELRRCGWSKAAILLTAGETPSEPGDPWPQHFRSSNDDNDDNNNKYVF